MSTARPRSWRLMHRVLYRLLVTSVSLLARSGRDKDLEIVVLRHQLTVLHRQLDRPALTEPDRSLLGAIAAALPRARRVGWLVTLTRCCAGTGTASHGIGYSRTALPGVRPSRRACGVWPCGWHARTRTPVANTFAERWMGTLRRELLDRTIIWNQHQVHRLVTEYVDHDNRHRPHRALQQQAPTAPHRQREGPPPTAEIIRLPRCDGLINEYKTAA